VGSGGSGRPRRPVAVGPGPNVALGCAAASAADAAASAADAVASAALGSGTAGAR